ncbi:MAG: FHA domain-containing protein [Deltaproteobacteria bacterium]|nr:FHA domain-containing protein [Deltaproteobacteria bacterium]
MAISTAVLPTPRADERVVALRHLATGNTWPLPDLPALAIGAAPECDVRITDVGVSAVHARLERTGPGWRVHDVSRNGTFLGGQRATTFDVVVGTRFDVARTPLVAVSSTMQGTADVLGVYLGLDQAPAISTALLAGHREATIVIVGPPGNGQRELARLLHHVSTRRRQPAIELIDASSGRLWPQQEAIPAATAFLDLREVALAGPLAAARAALLGDRRWRWIIAATSESQACSALRVPHLRDAHLIALPRLDERTDDRRALVERLFAQVAPVTLAMLPARTSRILLAPRAYASLDELRSLVRQVATLALTGVSANGAQRLGLHLEHLALLAEKLGFPPGSRR